jgi:hypothetical protein
MAPTSRRLLLVASLAAGVLAALILALPYVVSLDSTRARIVGAAESALHRKVEAGAIRLQILSGLGAGIEKVAVRNGPGWASPTLLSADRISVKIAFWPLLSRRVEVKKIVLDAPAVAIERDPKGSMNIDDFLAGTPSGGAEEPSAAALLVSRLEIARGRLLFIDRKVAPGQTVTVSLDDLTGEITDVGPASAARFDLAARFLADAGHNLALKGTLGPPPAGKGRGEAPLRATFEAKRLALARLRPYLGGSRATDPGLFSTDGTVEGALRGGLKLAGNIALAPSGPSSAIPPIEGKLAATLDWQGGSLAIARSPLAVARLPLTAEGRIDGLRAAPRIDLRLATPGDVPLDSVTGLPGLAGALPADVRLSGRVRLEAAIAGPSADLSTRARLDAAPLGVTLAGQPLFAAPLVRASASSRGKGPLTGRVTSPSGRLRKVPFKDLVADWTWANRSLTLAPTARVFGGRLAGRLETDLGRPASESRVTLDLRGVQAQPLVESLTSLRNVLAGSLTAKMSLASRGLSWSSVSKTARGDGRLTLTNVELRTLDLMPAVTRSLAAVGKVAGFQVPASLESTKFSTLAASLRLANGRLATPGLSLSGRDVGVAADGSLGLDRSLAYEGRVLLGPALVKSLGRAGRYLADEQGRLSLPFRVSGQAAAPKVAIDDSVVLDLGRRALARQARERIPGGVGKAIGGALEGGSGKKPDPFDILRQLLKSPSPTPTPH